MEILEKRKIKAEITGGGTLLGSGREPSNCDIDLEIKGDGPSALHVIIEALEGLGARVGSKARWRTQAVPFGTAEVLVLPERHRSARCRRRHQRRERAHNQAARAGRSGWPHALGLGRPDETALYFYGPSAQRMRAAMADVLASHPLAHSCRVEKLTPGTAA